MDSYAIAVIVGSLRRDSFNRRLAIAIARMAPPEFTFNLVRIDDLPLYNQDQDSNPISSVQRLRSDILSAQGVLFVTAEYNRSIPGVLKNAIDHASRPSGKSVWTKKPAGIMGVSTGSFGTSMAQQHLRNILSCLDMPTLGLPEAFIRASDDLFDSDGNIGPTIKQFLQRWLERYVKWIKKHQDE